MGSSPFGFGGSTGFGFSSSFAASSFVSSTRVAGSSSSAASSFGGSSGSAVSSFGGSSGSAVSSFGGSASPIETSFVSGCFLFRIAGYSPTKHHIGRKIGEGIESQRFSVGGYTWHIIYHRKGDCNKLKPDAPSSISFCLVLDDRVAQPLRARCKFSLLDRTGKLVTSCARTSPVLDWSTEQTWCCPDLIAAEDLEAGSDYLVDDCFTVRCDITFADRLAGAAEARAFVSVPPSDLHRHLGELLLREEGADVTFEVSGETFAAHRCVLAARSPVFRAQLFGPMKEGAATGVIRVDDMEAQVFGALLTFVYTDSLPETGDEQGEGAMAQHMLAAADRYGLERMKLICEEKLCEHIRASSVATVLALAEQHHCRVLKEACFEFLSCAANLEAFTEMDGFEQLVSSCPAVMKELLAKLATLLMPV